MVYQAPVPVLVIGNIYVGGTGKTPVLIALVNALKQKGWRPAVLSRGYGVYIGATPCIGQGELAPEKFGDEPALIALQTGAMVAVHPDRKKAIEALLACAPDTNLIVSDDGLQHLALARNLEIIVQDQRAVGNGYVMPAGPLRETTDRLKHVQAIITNVSHSDLREQTQPSSCVGLAQQGPKTTNVSLQISLIRNLMTNQPLTIAQFHSLTLEQPLAAAAGIGAPERFFDSLRTQGFKLCETLALPDHHTIKANMLSNLQARFILITAKDAIKCKHIHDERLWVVEASAVFSDPSFIDWLSNTLNRQLSKPSPTQP